MGTGSYGVLPTTFPLSTIGLILPPEVIYDLSSLLKYSRSSETNISRYKHSYKRDMHYPIGLGKEA